MDLGDAEPAMESEADICDCRIPKESEVGCWKGGDLASIVIRKMVKSTGVIPRHLW